MGSTSSLPNQESDAAPAPTNQIVVASASAANWASSSEFTQANPMADADDDDNNEDNDADDNDSLATAELSESEHIQIVTVGKETLLQHLQKVAGSKGLLPTLEEQAKFDQTCSRLVEVVQQARGGCGFLLTTREGFQHMRDLYIDVHAVDCSDSFPNGYMTELLRGNDIASQEFMDAILNFTSYTEDDRWPQGHEAGGLPKDGFTIMSMSGQIHKGAARIQGLPVPPWRWDRVGTRHMTALAACWTLRLYPSLLIVRSDSGPIHFLYADADQVTTLKLVREIVIVSAVSGNVYTRMGYDSYLYVENIKNKLMPDMLQHASKDAKLKLFCNGKELENVQQLCDLGMGEFEDICFSVLVLEPAESDKEAMDQSHHEALAFQDAELAAKDCNSDNTDCAAAEAGKTHRVQMEEQNGSMGEASGRDELSEYLLSIEKGVDLGLPPGYRSGHGVLNHEDTDITIRCPAFRLAPITPDDIFVYHYTHDPAFCAITGVKGPRYMRASFGERAHFGDGIYAASKSPAKFGSKEAILLNNYTNAVDPEKQEAQIKGWREKGVTDYCIPLIVPRSMAVNVMHEKTKEMKRAGYTARKFQQIRSDRDIIVVVLPEFTASLHETAESMLAQLASDDYSIRLSAVEACAQDAASGDEYATRLVMDMLNDSDHSVRVAAVWATACATSLTFSEARSKIAGLVDDPVKEVQCQVEEAFKFLDLGGKECSRDHYESI